MSTGALMIRPAAMENLASKLPQWAKPAATGVWKGALAAAVATVGINTVLPTEHQDSSLIGSKDAKLGIYLGAAGALVVARNDPKVLGYAWGAILGLTTADVGYALLNHPRSSALDNALHITPKSDVQPVQLVAPQTAGSTP